LGVGFGSVQCYVLQQSCVPASNGELDPLFRPEFVQPGAFEKVGILALALQFDGIQMITNWHSDLDLDDLCF